MNWTCPRCQSENQIATDHASQPYPQQTCASCGLVVDAQVEEPVRPPPLRQDPNPSSAANPTARRKRRTGSNLGTAIFVLGGLACAAFGFAASSGITGGLAITGGGLALIGVAMTYHIGERLDLILDELKTANEGRK